MEQNFNLNVFPICKKKKNPYLLTQTKYVLTSLPYENSFLFKPLHILLVFHFCFNKKNKIYFWHIMRRSWHHHKI